MNAGRDVERLIANWLAEEAAPGAPDRVLESTRRTIDRTMQRRWLAAWREPMTFTTTKVAALAAVLVLALAGAAWVGRSLAPVGGPLESPTPGPIVTPAPPAVTLETYRVARDEICLRYRPEINPLKVEVEGLYDPKLTPADRADKVAALATAADRVEAMANELAALAAPPELADQHRANVSSYDAIVVLLRSALAKIDKGDLAGAEAQDVASDAFNVPIAAYESTYRFLTCP